LNAELKMEDCEKEMVEIKTPIKKVSWFIV